MCRCFFIKLKFDVFRLYITGTIPGELSKLYEKILFLFERFDLFYNNAKFKD